MGPQMAWKNLEDIRGKSSIDSQEKTAVLGTVHKRRKVLQSETWSLSGGDYRWSKKRSTKGEKTLDKTQRNNNNNIIIMRLYLKWTDIYENKTLKTQLSHQ